jgi:hypothetical protein
MKKYRLQVGNDDINESSILVYREHSDDSVLLVFS